MFKQKRLYVAYDMQIRRKKWADESIDAAFTRSTDGESCPIAHNYTPAQFSAMCRQAGFTVRYVGGYFSDLELRLYRDLYQQALQEERLPQESAEFLRALTADRRGYPLYQGKSAGIGGVFLLQKPCPLL